MTLYDVVIVGAGMIGSAAARHASGPEVTVCLIGPSEPKDKSQEREIYGAHYDEGRITRSTDAHPILALLAQRSIERYSDLEQRSGIDFYRPVGSIAAGPSGSCFINKMRENARKQNVRVEELDADQLAERLHFLNFSSSDCAIFEPQKAGVINPRRLVKAQQMVASQQGCTIIDDVVNDIQQDLDANEQTIMKVTTGEGRVVRCRKVLLATGAFANFKGPLRFRQLDIKILPLTVALVEVDANDVEKLKSMPCVLYKGHFSKAWSQAFQNLDSSGTVGFYMLPPVKYPDGKFYVKLGHFHSFAKGRLETLDELKQWYIHGNAALAKQTADFIMSLFNGVKFKSWQGDYCAVTETTSDLPYIDMVYKQLGVAVGGNSQAAKSADEIGRLAANVILDLWDDDVIPRHLFKARYKKTSTSSAKI